MSRRSRRSLELPWLRPFISASLLDPSALSPVAFSEIDMENEIIAVHNFSDCAVSMGGYRICDFNQNHWFKFPASFSLAPRATVSVYCCPGLHMEKNPPEPFLQWTNKDGSLRSAHVLNDDKETVYLYDGAGLCVSTCSREHGKKAVVMRHSHLTNDSRNFMSKCKLFISYVRILSLLWGGCFAFSEPRSFLPWFLFGHLCDILGRCIWLGDSDIGDKCLAIDPLLDAINTTADRLSTIVVALAVLVAVPANLEAQFYTAFPLVPPTAFLWLMRLLFSKEHFAGLLILDFLSHWMRKNAEIYYASSLSSVTEAFKTPLHHLSEEIRVDSIAAGRSESAALKRRASRSRRKSKGHEDLGHSTEDPAAEQDAVYLEPWPDTDELDLIDILRVKFPLALSSVTVGHEIMLITAFCSVAALSDPLIRQAFSAITTSFPLTRELFLVLLLSTVIKEVLLLVQFLTSVSRVSFEVLSWKTRRQVIPCMR